jgi:putative phosphoribosyl transferase
VGSPERLVTITAGRHTLEASLVLPPAATAVVLFAHGSGSSRYSPRNRYVAEALNRAGLGTLLFDLLTQEEEAGDTTALRFDIALLAARLARATEWVGSQADTRALSIGYFGASTGAAAALIAAAERPGLVRAVVSRGGRPDLAGDALERVQAPTLLIVGGMDHQVLELNRRARRRLRAESQIAVVPGATHLFEEPGALEQVAGLAAGWFTRHLAAKPSRATA